MSRHWVNICSENGAHASAVLYSLVETAKANDLNVQVYLEFVLSELVRHKDDSDRGFMAQLLPWSNTVKKTCGHSQKA